MTDYLDARVRGRSESVASLPSSPFPIPKAPPSALLGAQVGPKVLSNTILKSHGRPPWYGEDGQPISPAFVIGIAGGSSSGKTHVARQIVRSLGSIPTVVIISQDSFYNKLTPEKVALAFASRLDLDHPDSIDMSLFATCLSDLKNLQQTSIPVYSFTLHQRLDETKYLYGATIIIGMVLVQRDESTLHDFFFSGGYTCSSRSLRTLAYNLPRYLRYVKPSYDNFVLPSSRYADIIVPGQDNAVAIELISTHIRRQLEQRSRHFRRKMADSLKRSLSKGPPRELAIEELGLTVLEQTPQLKGIYTVLRDRTSTRQDFIFFTDRLATLLVERAMEKLPYREVAVETPVGERCKGKAIDVDSLCGVTILRSGGPLEQGLQRVISDVAIGSLLTGEPLLFQVRLPECIRARDRASDTWVFLLDAQIGTGAAGFMAIRPILSSSPSSVAHSGGVAHLRRTFPDVNIVTGAVDDGLREVWLENAERHKVFPDEDGFDNEEQHKAWVIEPGMGQIGESPL
ncbi:armadillo/beta-catenin/plakoglobin [Lactarius deliciosus]|nr:armadillo/beta-catenin/plakoglobin [Lactarius deliciosus]